MIALDVVILVDPSQHTARCLPSGIPTVGVLAQHFAEVSSRLIIRSLFMRLPFPVRSFPRFL
jgi:hypothetical protein